MKTTIIELLNKIANGEEPPKKIKYHGYIFIYQENHYDYKGENGVWLCDSYVISAILNDEVEILETTINWEEKVKRMPVGDIAEVNKQDKIEKLDILKQNNKTYLESYCYNYTPLEKLPLSNEEIAFVFKINEIIEVLNENK